MGIKHNYQSGSTNNAGKEVSSTRWNENHVIDSEVIFPAISTPSAPAADTLALYAAKTGGRMLPWLRGPSGLYTALQPSLFGNHIASYFPTSGTTVTGGFGTIWAKGSSSGTVSHPNLATTNLMTSMRRTRHANAVTTTNQVMGIGSVASNVPWLWRGNAAGLGGFFFFARFGIGLWAAGSRIFCGLTAAETGSSDTLGNNSVGLWRTAADTANTLSFATRDGTNTNLTAISGATIAANTVFDVYIFAKPNDTVVYFRVDQLGADGAPTTLIDSSTSTNLPTNTTFLGPLVAMSNGTANTTANTVAVDVNRIYCESDH